MRHDGDCNIYRADYPYCNCGLMHRLQFELSPEDLYPNYERDWVREWAWQRELKYPMPEPKAQSPEELAECDRLLQEFAQRYPP